MVLELPNWNFNCSSPANIQLKSENLAAATETVHCSTTRKHLLSSDFRWVWGSQDIPGFVQAVCEVLPACSGLGWDHSHVQELFPCCNPRGATVG